MQEIYRVGNALMSMKTDRLQIALDYLSKIPNARIEEINGFGQYVPKDISQMGAF